jgi:hypothetical protein
MHPLLSKISPDRNQFAADPFGYSALAWHRWVIAQEIAGFPGDPTKTPTSEDLKSPILWLSQAHALSEAAATVIRGTPNLNHMPVLTRGVCDSQYCAVGLMLVGYSLEICLKAMLILRLGAEAYSAEERKHKHHDLVKLSSFIPDLSEKDKAILTLLTHFLMWAGRYPDPGSGREENATLIFELSEKHQISAKDLFVLASRVMRHVQESTS